MHLVCHSLAILQNRHQDKLALLVLLHPAYLMANMLGDHCDLEVYILLTGRCLTMGADYTWTMQHLQPSSTCPASSTTCVQLSPNHLRQTSRACGLNIVPLLRPATSHHSNLSSMKKLHNLHSAWFQTQDKTGLPKGRQLCLTQLTIKQAMVLSTACPAGLQTQGQTGLATGQRLRLAQRKIKRLLMPCIACTAGRRLNKKLNQTELSVLGLEKTMQGQRE